MYFQMSYGCRLMLNTFIFRYRGWISFATITGALWYVIFQWNSVDYPNYAKGPCYSPNHAYYITRHQTLWQATNLSYPADFGTARLFDRLGKLLYEGPTFIDGQAGPFWSSGFENDPSYRPEVFYVDGGGPNWGFVLSESPGEGNPNKNCYPETVN